MIKTVSKNLQPGEKTSGVTPSLNIKKLGIVSRNYRTIYGNGRRDFSHSMHDVLALLDEKGCDAVLFSLYSVVVTSAFSVLEVLKMAALKCVKVVLLEEFIDTQQRDLEFPDKEKREAGRFVVYYLLDRGWQEYEFKQSFGTTIRMKRDRIDAFIKQEMPKRILGNSAVLLCGETNIVKYSKKIDQQIHDDYGVLDQIPNSVKVILNPIHDRMTRFEMKLKREFLSKNDRVVISVWNKGRPRDGANPAWTVYKDGKSVVTTPMSNGFGLEIGIVDC